MDPLPVDVARLDELAGGQRIVKLENHLVIGGTCLEEECGRFKQFLLAKHDLFAMSA